jgi:hypothetical protein
VKVYRVYVNKFEVNYTNASLSGASPSLSEVQYCKKAKV